MAPSGERRLWSSAGGSSLRLWPTVIDPRAAHPCGLNACTAALPRPLKMDGNNEPAPSEGRGTSQTCSTMPMVNYGERIVVDPQLCRTATSSESRTAWDREPGPEAVTSRRSRLDRSKHPTRRQTAEHCEGAGRGNSPSAGSVRARCGRVPGSGLGLESKRSRSARLRDVGPWCRQQRRRRPRPQPRPAGREREHIGEPAQDRLFHVKRGPRRRFYPLGEATENPLGRDWSHDLGPATRALRAHESSPRTWRASPVRLSASARTLESVKQWRLTRWDRAESVGTFRSLRSSTLAAAANTGPECASSARGTDIGAIEQILRLAHCRRR
jgi:hypothetical protein